MGQSKSSFRNSVCLALIAWTCFAVNVNADTLNLGPYTGSSIDITFNGNPSSQSTFGAADLQVGATDISLDLFCVDLTRDIFLIPGYDAATTHDGKVFGTSVQNADQIAWLIQHEISSAPLQSDARLGLQAAIWQVEYGNSFVLVNSTTDTFTAFQTYLSDLTTALSSGPVPSVNGNPNFYWISPTFPGFEFQGVVGYATAVPEPSSLALLAFGGLFVAVRRRVAF